LHEVPPLLMKNRYSARIAIINASASTKTTGVRFDQRKRPKRQSGCVLRKSWVVHTRRQGAKKAKYA
ncbi:MAG: hypothetical protein AAGG72_06985, partial [Pseudomonadota bacterium]